MNEGDVVFAGSVRAIYQRYLVPMLFEPYAEELAVGFTNVTVEVVERRSKAPSSRDPVLRLLSRLSASRRDRSSRAEQTRRSGRRDR